MLDSTTVLTAAHGIPVPHDELIVRWTDGTEKPATVRKREHSDEARVDLAILEVHDSHIDIPRMPVLKGPPEGLTILRNCEAIGFPTYRQKELPNSNGKADGTPAKQRDSAHLYGEIPLGDNMKSGLLTFHMSNVVKVRSASSWKGMSGAAIIFDKVILGIVSQVIGSSDSETALVEPRVLIVVPIWNVVDSVDSVEWGRLLTIRKFVDDSPDVKNYETLTRYSELPIDREFPVSNSEILQWSPQGTRIAFVSSASVILYDHSVSRSWILPKGLQDAPKRLAWSPNGRFLLLAGGHDRFFLAMVPYHALPTRYSYSLEVWDTWANCYYRTIDGHNNAVVAACWRDEDEVITADTGGEIRSSRRSTGSSLVVRNDIDVSFDAITAIHLSPDAHWLAVANHSLGTGDIAIYKLDSERRQATILYNPFEGRERRIQSVGWSPDSQRIAVVYGHNDLVIWSWSLRGWQPRNAARIIPNGVTVEVAWSPDGNSIATVTSSFPERQSSLCLFRIDRACSSTLLAVGHGQQIFGLTWSADSQRIAATLSGEILRIWRAGPL